jgi:ATP-dependent helicase YprA (DUF1998 family)
LSTPVEEMGLPVEIETRTGDTPQSRRQRQKLNPPDILLTTPEQLALLLSHKDAERFFSDLRYVVLDELHSLVTSKRGHLLALGLARLHRLCPHLKATGLSATVSEPDLLRQWLVPQRTGSEMAELVTVAGGAKPDITILKSKERVPWSGHSARYAMPEVYEAIRAAQDDAALRQHALAVGTAVPGTVEDQRRQPADRAASRLARRQPAAQGRTGDAGEFAARHRRHLDARSRHRLGRCRSRRPCRLAEGRVAGWRSGSGAPITAWTKRRRRSSCRPTVSR